MTNQKRTAASALAAAVALAAGGLPASAADDQSWLCRYLPSACAHDEDPGGLPGHAAGGAASDSSASRGVSKEEEPPLADSVPEPSPMDGEPAAPETTEPEPQD